jgi:basic membrane protein A
VALAACGSSTNSGSGGGGGAATTGGAGGSGLKVGMAYDVGGRGDQSFNDAAAAGLDKAVKDLGVQSKEAAATNGEAESARQERLQQLIDAGYTNVVAVGFAYAKSVGAAAKLNPNVKFAIVDDASPDSAGPNVDQITFAEEQGSFLVGAAAALKSKTNQVGFVGGVATDLIKKFEAGYIAGAKAANPSVTVKSQYLSQPPDFSGFNDPAKGKELAAAQYEAGADVVYSAAGGSGLGAVEAAAAAGEPGTVWAIGVDSDQYELVSPELQPYILTSMLKKVDVATYDTIAAYCGGTFEGGVKVYDIASDGVGYSTSGGFVDDISADLDGYAEQIASGEIEVPTAP